MSVIENVGAAFEGCEWWEPGMSEREIQLWVGAEQQAAQAPALKPSDDVYLEMRQLMGGCLAPAREERGAA